MEKYISDFFKISSDNIRAIIKGDFEEGVTDLNTLGNHALMRIDRKSVTPSVKDLPKLTKEQKKQIKQFTLRQVYDHSLPQTLHSKVR